MARYGSLKTFAFCVCLVLAGGAAAQTSLSVPDAVWPGYGIENAGITPNLGQTLQINAADEYLDLAGQVYWSDGAASKVCSSAGCSIILRQAGVTFVDAGTTIRIGIQDPDAASGPPVRGDGTFDVSADLVGGTDTISANASRETPMESGTKTIAIGQLIVVKVLMVSRGGSDVVVVANFNTYANQSALPAVVHFPGTGPTAQSAKPNVIIQSDDGTVGWLLGTSFADAITQRSFDSGTGTADEYCSGVTFPVAHVVHGIIFRGRFSGGAGDAEVLLYSAPASSPVAERTTTIDTNTVASTSSDGDVPIPFATPYTVTASAQIALCIRPTATDADAITYDYDFGAITEAAQIYQSFDASWSKLTRLDNSGAFTEDTGAIMTIGALITAVPSGGGSGGVIGGPNKRGGKQQ